MKNVLLLKVHIAILFMVTLAMGISAQQYDKEKESGKIRIKLNSSVLSSFPKLKSTRSGVETGIVSFDAVSSKVSTKGLKRVFPYSAKHEDKHRKYGLHLWYEIDYSADYDPQQVANEYAKLREVSQAECVRSISFDKSKPTQLFSAAELAEIPFDDPKLSKQWHYYNDGTIVEGAVAGADINLFEAWKKQTGSPNVVVAIIDGGIDLTHPDLRDAVWVNEVEKNGESGVDDDGNGYIDDIYGYNFASDLAEIEAHYHGTHVAGTVGATNNNGVGVAGVAGGNGIDAGTKLMSCQILVEDGTTGGMAEALIYAADNGAVIAQCSWGWRTDGFYEQVVLDAIDYFINEAGSYAGSPMKGGLAVFAAGNESVEMEIYPAAYEPVIAVAAMDYTNGRAGYSCYGTWVDVTAPGGLSGMSNDGGVLSTLPGGQYGTLQGTSMACPHVAGIAALVVAEYGGSDFTPDKLKRHILTSVRDIEPYLSANESGKMGSGYIDAAMALQSGSITKAPAKVSDLLVETSQDKANISWSVVADEDDGIGSSYTLYWSKNEFNANSLELAASTIVYTFFNEVGDEVDYVLKDLDSRTNYYFAIQAFDRWGNASGLSDIIMVATNNGPAIEVVVEETDVAIDVASDNMHSSTIKLKNNDEGLLQWSSYIGLSKSELDSYSETIYEPVRVTGSSSHTIRASEVANYPTIDAPVSMSIDDRLTYNESAAYVYVGDEDVSFPNSSATRYYITEDFNVTNFWVELDFAAENGPATVEFYKGAQIQDAQLITSQEIESEGDYQTTYYVDMEEQVYLEADNYYWVVFHIPPGNQYPLGLTKETEDLQSDNCLFSTNGGQSWKFINDEYGDTNDWVWKLTLRSLNVHLGNYITLSPAEGMLSGNSSKDLQLDIDAQYLIDGTYTENLVFASNDPLNKLIKKQIIIDVDGHEPKLKSKSIVDFGDVFVGKSKTYNIQVVNEGYAGYQLDLSFVTSSNPDFIVNKVSDTKVPARGEATIQVMFKPSVYGMQSANIQLDNGTYIYSFKVTGVAAEPAKIDISPALASIGTGLTIGDAVEPLSFNITNIGKYPLSYSIPDFAGDFEVDGLERPVNGFGYTYNYALDLGSDYTGAIPAEHGWKDMSVSTGATNIVDKLKGSDFAVQVDLGFSFPYYDRFYDKAWINEQGVLVFGEDGNLRLNNSRFTSSDRFRPLDMISAAMVDAKYDNANAAVYYQQFDGEFRVEYKTIELGERFVNVQIVLYANGDYDVLFGSVNRDANELPNYFVGMTDKDNQQHVIASNSDYPLAYAVTTDYGSYFHFKHPGEDMVIAAENAFGTLLPDESATVKLSFDTRSALQGDVFQRVPVISNDVLSPMSVFEITAGFIAGGSPEIELLTDTVDFGTVLKTSAHEQQIKISNKGTANEEIISIDFSNSAFSTSVELPYVIKPRQVSYIPIDLNTNQVVDLDELVTLTLGSGEALEVRLLANIAENPIIAVMPVEGFTETVDARTYKDVDLIVSNSGLGVLEMSVIPNEWCYPVYETNTTENAGEFRYNYVKGDGAGWVDILDVAAETNLYDDFWGYGASMVYKKLTLPTPFYFYGKEYNDLYLSAIGWVSFEEPTDMTNIFETPYDFPQEDFFHGGLVPMAGPHTNASKTIHEDAGIYYHAFEDKYVITFNKFVDRTGSMSEPYDFQLVLHYNGRVDFNYKNFDQVKVYSIIGFESPDEKQGTVILQQLLNGSYDAFSYTLLPIKKEVVEAQSSKTVKMRLDASGLYDGTYEYELPVENNSVDVPVVNLPINLTVNGEAELVAENIMSEVWYVPDSVYKQGFKIKNVGTKVIDLLSSTSTLSDDMKVEFYYPAGGGILNAYPEGYVNIDDFVGQQITSESWFRPTLIADGTKLEAGDEWQCYVTYEPTQPGTSIATSTIKDINGNVVLTWSASLTSELPPVATIGQDVVVMADKSTYTETRTFNISNVNGASELEWTAQLHFERGAKVSDDIYESASAAPNATTAMLNSEVNLNATQAGTSLKAMNTYNRTLKHVARDAVDNWLGFGGAVAFTSATKFTVPHDGFTLSHVETWYRYESQNEGTLYVEILAGGSSIDKAQLVAKGLLDYKEDGYDDKGKYYTISLDESVYLYPNEDFYVVVRYPLGISNCQGINKDMASASEGKYFYQYDGEWYDIYLDPKFYDNAFMVKAHEEEYIEKTWVKLLQNKGTVATGDEVNIDLDFNAEHAPEYINKAELTITTNDPVNPEQSVDVLLLMNKGPQFKHVQGLNKIEENSSSTIEFSVKDLENDSYTVELLSEADWMQLTTNEGGTVEITLTPGYFDQGLHNVELRGEDEHGEQSGFVYPIEVININRPPYFTYGELKDTIMVLGHGAHEISFEELITDDDKDEMNFNVTLSNKGVIDLFIGESGIVLTPFSIGNTDLTISVTDAYGEKLSGSYNITVVNRTGLDSVEDGTVEVYPNPASDFIVVHLKQQNNTDVIMRLMNVDGTIVKELKSNGQQHRLNIDHLSKGIYLLEITSGSEVYITKVIKQ